MIRYETPNINKQKTLGLNTHLEFFRRKKTFYQTINNELVYFENNDSYTSNEMLLNVEFIYRKNLKTKHKINLDYHATKVDTGIIFRNLNIYIASISWINITVSIFMNKLIAYFSKTTLLF